MKKITELIGHNLQWVQPQLFTPKYELYADGELAAVMKFPDLTASARVENADDEWEMQLLGPWISTALIQRRGDPGALAVYKRLISGKGRVELANNRHLWVRWTPIVLTVVEFQTELGEPLVCFRNHERSSRSVAIEPQARQDRLAEIPWLAFFGFYITLVQEGRGFLTA